MEEEANFCIEVATEKMEKAIQHLEDELMRIRAGKASPNILDGISIDYYGAVTPLSQVSNIGTPDAKTVVIQPWDKSMLEPIERAILYANIGLTPMNNGELIRLNIPRLTEERRRDLVRVVARRVEEARVAIRNLRRDALQDLKEFEKEKMISEDDFYHGKDKVQELTDEFIETIDEMGSRKEVEVMEV